MSEPLYITPAELIARLAALGIIVTDSTLRSWRARGVGPEWVKIEGSVYYFSDRVQPWIDSGRPDATEPAP